MPAKRSTIVDLASWPSLHLEGGLIAPAMVAKIAAPKNDEETRASYKIRKGLTVREEITTAYRVGQRHFNDFKQRPNPSAQATRRFAKEFLAQTFGFDDLAEAEAPVAFVAGVGGVPVAEDRVPVVVGRVPVVVVPPVEEKLDTRSETLSVDRFRSPASALQDYLNERDEALWGLVTNGTQIRLMRDNASLTRPAYIEANLEHIFVNEDVASFAVLWLLIHRTRFGARNAPATDCDLERWRDAGAREGEAARDRLADQVKIALKTLGSGFLEANTELAAQLKSGEVNLTEWFNELLRLVYRLIFLMVAEDRDLLHAGSAGAGARKLYAEGYSLAHLRAQCIRRATWNKHRDRYEALKIVFRALAEGELKLGVPALGGLFSAGQLPRLATAKLRNRALMDAIYRLSFLPAKSAPVRVNWRAMETEELGSVYETLLELQPQIDPDGRTLVFASDLAETKGNQRKTTGSYYTPDSLVQALLDSALDPVLDEAETAADDPAEALLGLSVIDPACGSGHFLLAAARRIATRVARHRAEGTPSAADYRHALRDVARRCIHGVDRNPMAVELTKVALWIETVDPGLPLGFLDAQIRCGDALLGLFDLAALEEGIPDAAYKPLAGDDRPTANYYRKANKDAKTGQTQMDFATGEVAMSPIRPLASNFSDFRDLPEETVEQIGTKAERFKDLQASQDFRQRQTAADLYVAAFLLPKIGGKPPGPSLRTVPTTEELWIALSPEQAPSSAMTDALQAARSARAFHWPLEFPDIMQRGGFDAVLGNPPWERIKLQEKEFFALRDADIATAANKAARDRLIKALAAAEPTTAERRLFDEFTQAKRLSEATSTFVRVPGDDGGRFPFTGRGDVNTYALFAELFSCLASERGRAGVIVPTGIATDATTAPFFAHLVEEKRLASLVDFENRRKLFAAVDSRMKFCLLALGHNEPEAHFAFFLTEPAQLAEPERNFTLSPEQIAAINPNTRTAPVFRSRADAELTAKIYRNAPVLIDESKGAEGNPWGVSFARLFDMSNDSGLFRTAAQLEQAGFRRDGTDWLAESGRADSPRRESVDPHQHEPLRYVPLYEAKMIHQFDHRWAGYPDGDSGSANADPQEKTNPDFEPSPRYWVPQAEVAQRLSRRGWNRQWLMGWRDITNATNERTVISAVFPRAGVNHKIPLLFTGRDVEKQTSLLGNLNSLVLDFATRNKVGGTNLAYFYLKQFPILTPAFCIPGRLDFVTPRVLELTSTSDALASFARDLGYDGPPYTWDEDRRAQLRADLDAFYARAYGLTRNELLYILDPADVKGPDYPAETFRVLKEREIRQHGEYRTCRLVLAAYDRMEADGEFAAMDL